MVSCQFDTVYLKFVAAKIVGRRVGSAIRDRAGTEHGPIRTSNLWCNKVEAEREST